MSKKLKIILDTNIVFLEMKGNFDNVFNSRIKDITNFIRKYKLEEVSLSIPNVVVSEMITHRTEHVEKTINDLDNLIKELRLFGIKIPAKDYRRRNVRDIITKKARKFLKQENINIIKTPNIKSDILLDRAFKRIKPFNKKDKGFKDTMIWISILGDVKNNKDSDYVLCTENNIDFELESLNKEFKKISKSNFFIFNTTSDLKEFLDNRFVLKLEIKKIHEEIKESIKRTVGDIILEVNKYRDDRLYNNPLMRGNYFSAYQVGGLTSLWGEKDKDIVGYNYRDLDFLSISEISEDEYQVNINLSVEVKYKEENSYLNINESILNNPYSSMYNRDGVKNFLVIVNYNKKTDSKNIKSIQELAQV